MLETIEREQNETKLARYKGQLNVIRKCVYFGLACLLIIYLSPLFTNGRQMGVDMGGGQFTKAIMANRTWVQIGVLLIAALAIVASNRRPFIVFLLLFLFISFFLAAMLPAIYIIAQYANLSYPFTQGDLYKILTGLALFCATFLWGTIVGYKYEKLSKHITI